MLKHCVFAKIKDDTPQGEVDRILNGFGTLVGEVEGMVDYCHGPNRDFENKSAEYRFGFICTFADRAAHLAYETHPTHQHLGAALCDISIGGYDGITVFDLEV